MRPRTSSSASASSCAWARTSSALPEVDPDPQDERGEALRPGGRPATIASIIAIARPVSPAAARWRISATARRASGRPIVDRRQAQAVRRRSSAASARRAPPTRPIGASSSSAAPWPLPFDRRQGEVAGPIVGIGHDLGQAAMEGAAGVRLHVAEGDRSEQRVGAAHQHRVVEREQAAVDGVGEPRRDIGLAGRGPQPLRARRTEGGRDLHDAADRRRGAPRGAPKACCRASAGRRAKAVPIEVGRAGELEGVHRIARRRARGRARAPAGRSSSPRGSTWRIASIGSTPSMISSVRSGLSKGSRRRRRAPCAPSRAHARGRSSRRRRA